MTKRLQSLIVYDNHNCLRFRLGPYYFNQSEGFYVENQLSELNYIREVRCNYRNGSIRIKYDGDTRVDVIKALRHLLSQPLKEDTANLDREQQLLAKEHFNQFLTMSIRRQFMRLFMPQPLGKVVLLAKALPYFKEGLQALLSGKLNVAVLDATSIGVSMLRQDFRTAGSVIYLLKVSDIMLDYTEKHAKNSLRDSLAISIDQVWRVEGNQEELIPYSELRKGDVIHIHQGNMIPVDGVVVNGNALVNEATMTGESEPVHKHRSVSVYAGTVIEDGDLEIKVDNLAQNSRISKIVEMIDNSEQLKSNAQNRADNLADRIVPFSYLAFAGTWLLSRNIQRAISILMVDYSCALKLTVPISIITAMRDGANRKMLIKGGKHFENFSSANAIVFDKTGTLTKASPKVKTVLSFNGYERDDILKTAACLEEHFPHSLARAIVKQAEIEDIYHAEEHGKVEYIVAHGIASILNEERALIGSSHFIYDDEHVEKDDAIEAQIAEELIGLSVIRLAIGGKLVGAIGVEDEIRDEAKEVIAELHEQGFKVVMLTGDNPANAKRTADILGIDTVYSGVLPDEKANIIKELKQDYRVVMVGDGINDSPALSEADISIAMGDASDIARETADITLMHNDLRGILSLRDLSLKLFQRIDSNYRYILGVNSAIMALGALGALSPLSAALYHNTSTVLLSARSMLPYKIEEEHKLLSK